VRGLGLAARALGGRAGLLLGLALELRLQAGQAFLGLLAGALLGLLAHPRLLFLQLQLELRAVSPVGLLAGALGRLGRLALHALDLGLGPRLRLDAGALAGLTGHPVSDRLQALLGRGELALERDPLRGLLLKPPLRLVDLPGRALLALGHPARHLGLRGLASGLCRLGGRRASPLLRLVSQLLRRGTQLLLRAPSDLILGRVEARLGRPRRLRPRGVDALLDLRLGEGRRGLGAPAGIVGVASPHLRPDARAVRLAQPRLGVVGALTGELQLGAEAANLGGELGHPLLTGLLDDAAQLLGERTRARRGGRRGLPRGDRAQPRLLGGVAGGLARPLRRGVLTR
jgi:hypothetical protein